MSSVSSKVAVFCLLVNAFVWGVSWWPFRYLDQKGLHSLWATTLIFSVIACLITLIHPTALMTVWRRPRLWILIFAAGCTNAFFNWAVTIGDVVRIVLLFYVMPVWTVILARLVLNEPITAQSLTRVMIALAGAGFVLWPDGSSQAAGLANYLPLPRNLAEWLGLAGGMSFALNNVMLRKLRDEPEAARALSMFLGGSLCAGLIATVLTHTGAISAPPFERQDWWLGTGLLCLGFLIGNLALQVGAARLPANVVSLVMLSEILFASVSAAWLGGGLLTQQTLVGAALIIGASALALQQQTKEKET